ncbi:unnamed protein product [Amoebophrya sp. A25]|nr:unnamed protein product [Amoebophrya sp. A25]|eukprot:GSA25T00015037001.1
MSMQAAKKDDANSSNDIKRTPGVAIVIFFLGTSLNFLAPATAYKYLSPCR